MKNQGVQDIFIACVDGLKGFPEAIEAVFPKTGAQLCIVHMVRHSLHFVSWKVRKAVVADLRTIHKAATVEEAEMRLAEFDTNWGAEYSSIVQSWQRNWMRIVPFFDYPVEIRKVIYAPKGVPLGGLHQCDRVRLYELAQGHQKQRFISNDDALIKLYYLTLRNISKKWSMPAQNWKAALNRFTIMFDERMPRH